MRYRILLLMIVAVVVAFSPTAAAADVVSTSGLTPDQVQVVQSAWDTFAAKTSARASCVRPPMVQGEDGYKNKLGGAAVYRTAETLVMIDPSFIDENHDFAAYVLWHEFAHHTDFICGASYGLSPQFQEVENMDPSSWWSSKTALWKDTPAEAFAPITAGLIADKRPVEPIYVSGEAVSMVAEWWGMPTPSWLPPTTTQPPTTTTTQPPPTTTTTT